MSLLLFGEAAGVVVAEDLVFSTLGVPGIPLAVFLVDDADCRFDMLMEIDGVSDFPEASGDLGSMLVTCKNNLMRRFLRVPLKSYCMFVVLILILLLLMQTLAVVILVVRKIT